MYNRRQQGSTDASVQTVIYFLLDLIFLALVGLVQHVLPMQQAILVQILYCIAKDVLFYQYHVQLCKDLQISRNPMKHVLIASVMGFVHVSIEILLFSAAAKLIAYYKWIPLLKLDGWLQYSSGNTVNHMLRYVFIALTVLQYKVEDQSSQKVSRVKHWLQIIRIVVPISLLANASWQLLFQQTVSIWIRPNSALPIINTIMVLLILRMNPQLSHQYQAQKQHEAAEAFGDEQSEFFDPLASNRTIRLTKRYIVHTEENDMTLRDYTLMQLREHGLLSKHMASIKQTRKYGLHVRLVLLFAATLCYVVFVK